MTIPTSFAVVAEALLLLSVLGRRADAFYVPGVNPLTFQEGDEVPLKVNALTSTHTQLPRDYYRLPFCQPNTGPQTAYQNMGEYWTGNRIQNSPYQIHLLEESYCQKLCQVQLDKYEAAKLRLHIKYGYHNNWIMDNLPSAAIGVGREGEEKRRYAGGFPIGFLAQDDWMPYIYNHVNIHVDYHPVEDGGRIVGFAVEPLSVKHQFRAGYEWDGISADGLTKLLETCSATSHLTREDIVNSQIVKPGEIILFTYDVIWEESDVEWGSRWDIYLTENHLVPDQVHWYSIVNGAFVMLVLAGIIVAILVKNVRNDLNDDSEYEAGATSEEARAEELEEKGWKLVHVDVFGPPTFSPLLLAVCCGIGAQLFCTALATIFVGYFGLLSPSARGHLIMFIFFIYILMGIVNGYVTARLYKMFKGEDWKVAVQVAAWAFSGLTFFLFMSMSTMSWVLRSSYAVPFSTLVITALSLGISVPLVHIGAYVGHKQDAIEIPNSPQSIFLGTLLNQHSLSKMSCCSRCLVVLAVILFNVVSVTLALLWLWRRWLIKRNCWSPTWSGVIMLLTGGAIAFASMYVESFFILTAVWMDQYYYVFGFLFLDFCIVSLTSAEVSILVMYSQLCNEKLHSWWWQFCYGGSVSILLFIYSFFFFLSLEGANMLFVPIIYFGFMAWVSLALFLMMGFLGVAASLWFVKTLFSVAKPGDDYQPLILDDDRVGEYLAMELPSPEPVEEQTTEGEDIEEIQVT